MIFQTIFRTGTFTGIGLNKPNVAPALAPASAAAPKGSRRMTGVAGYVCGDCGGGRVAMPPESNFCPSNNVSLAGYGLSGKAKLPRIFCLKSVEHTLGTCEIDTTCSSVITSLDRAGSCHLLLCQAKHYWVAYNTFPVVFNGLQA